MNEELKARFINGLEAIIDEVSTMVFDGNDYHLSVINVEACELLSYLVEM